MQLTPEKKQALIFSLSQQALLIDHNAKEMDKLGSDYLSSQSEIMKQQAEDARDNALFIDENL